MNYDNWKLGDGLNPRHERLADKCSDIESITDAALTDVSLCATIEPCLADFDDQEQFSVEVAMSITVPVKNVDDGPLEVAEALQRMANTIKAKLKR